jgi:hypothetical protein
MARIASTGEDLTGKVCCCSLGRVGIIARRETVKFQNGDVAECWVGLGFDGRGLWATSAGQVVVLDECLGDYLGRVKARPNNLAFGVIAVPAPKN